MFSSISRGSKARFSLVFEGFPAVSPNGEPHELDYVRQVDELPYFRQLAFP
jgi:hypothetical protein